MGRWMSGVDFSDDGDVTMHTVGTIDIGNGSISMGDSFEQERYAREEEVRLLREAKEADLKVADIDRCGYHEPNDDGDIQCERIGVGIIVTDPHGRKVLQYRCEEHGWEPGESTLHKRPNVHPR
jgi:hypothetical protein